MDKDRHAETDASDQLLIEEKTRDLKEDFVEEEKYSFKKGLLEVR